jgi:HK97 family phage major capsid protein
MAILNTDLGGALRAVDTGQLVEIPWRATSVALAVTTVVNTTSSEWRCPVLDSDVTSAFVNQNESIDLSDPVLDSCVVTPRALATLTRVADEALADSSPAAISIISDSIVRSLAFATDKSWVAATTPKGPPGLTSLVGNGAQAVDVVGSIVDLNPFISAIGLLEAHGAKATAFIADSRTWTALALLRQFEGTDLSSNVPLLGADPTAPQGRSIQGVPAYSLREGILDPGQVIVIDGSRVFTVIREGIQLDTSKDLYFDARATAVRASTRIAYAFPDPASVCFINSGGS